MRENISSFTQENILYGIHDTFLRLGIDTRADSGGKSMLNLKNDVNSLEELIEKKKRIVLYGAGASARLLIKSYRDILPAKSLEFIVDGNEALDGKFCVADESTRVKIISLKRFCELWAKKMDTVTLLFTPYYSPFFIKQLDEISGLDGAEAYVYSFIVNNKPPKKFVLRDLEKPVIPKLIHYFWIGGSKLPQEYERNIESWRRFCPNYQIIQWNESNYDFGKCRYAREAVKSGQYMYATDVARKDILYNYGGIYLDTDVELLRSLDDLLYHEAWIGIDDGGQLNSGSGLGCVKHNPVIGEMLRLYEDRPFIKEDGSFCTYYNTFYETELMIEKGYKIKNEYQKIQGMSCFPREVLMPEGVTGVPEKFTEMTVANHKINPYDKTQISSVRRRLCG